MGGLAAKDIVTGIPAQTVINQNEFDYCAVECEYKELVFADLSDNAPHKNDFSSFLFRKQIAADSINFELYKEGVKITDLTDNTYGIYYATFTEQALQTGFVIDWNAVLSLQGPGNYQFRAQQTIIGVSEEFQSRCFKLYPYSDEIADNTIKIETFQNGNIISSDVDYTDILENGWFNSYRIPGKFGNKTPIFVQDNLSSYINQDYQELQIREQVQTEFTLQSRLIPALIFNILFYDSVLADTILITDYTIFNEDIYRRVAVRPASPEDITPSGISRQRTVNIKFRLQTDNAIKKTR